METLRGRLRQYYDSMGLSLRAGLARAGISYGAISPGTVSLTVKTQERIATAYPDLSMAWLLTGEGSMLRGGVEASTVSVVEDEPVATIAETADEGRPYYDVDFLGGYGEFAESHSVSPSYNIDYQPYNREGVFYVNIYGDSMEPKFSSGDIIAMRQIEDWGWIPYGRIYGIVTTNDMRTIKMIERGADDDHFNLVPINDNYDEQEIPKSYIRAIFEVLGGIRRLG